MLMHAALRAPALTTVGDVARSFELSATHLNKVAQTLAEHGFVQTVRGRFGGIGLARSPELIRLGDVVRVTEPDFQIAPCMAPGNGGCAIHGSCELRNVLARAADAFLAELDQWTLADMVREPAPMLIAIDRARPARRLPS
jgi:Rrf2 family nitric oxide-sensitive transcriptional repressor